MEDLCARYVKDMVPSLAMEFPVLAAVAEEEPVLVVSVCDGVGYPGWYDKEHILDCMKNSPMREKCKWCNGAGSWMGHYCDVCGGRGCVRTLPGTAKYPRCRGSRRNFGRLMRPCGTCMGTGRAISWSQGYGLVCPRLPHDRDTTPPESGSDSPKQHVNNSSDYYEILGVAKQAPLQDIEKAYRRLALKYHPDKNPADPRANQDRFVRINTAYQVLSDEDARRAYVQERSVRVKQ